MKTLVNYSPNPDTNLLMQASGLRSFGADRPFSTPPPFNSLIHPEPAYPALAATSILTSEATAEIASDGLPDMSQLCLDLFQTFFQQNAPYSALQFVPVLKALGPLNRTDIKRILKNPETRHVLVNNPLLKVVLIHWKPGTFSGIHGHPKGGCVFKILRGSLEEKRYSPEQTQQQLGVSSLHSGSMAYIDDNMAYHAVGNPGNTSAISLHVYTSGGN